MRWADVRAAYPDRWLIIEAVEAHSEPHRRVLDRIVVVEKLSDGETTWRRYWQLHREDRKREIYPVHTSNAEPEIGEVPAPPRFYRRHATDTSP